jgi:hypothetical protein
MCQDSVAMTYQSKMYDFEKSTSEAGGVAQVVRMPA